MGRAVLARAGESGVDVRAFARRPETLAGVAEDVVGGDVQQVETIASALSGIDTVVSVLGSRPRSSSPHLLEDGTRNIVAAMTTRGLRRLLCVTGMGAGDSRGHGPWWYDALVRPTILRSVYADKERQEEVVRRSGLEWTIVRPAVLAESRADRVVRAEVALAPGEKMRSLTRDDVARFLLTEVRRPAHVGQTVHLFT